MRRTLALFLVFFSISELPAQNVVFNWAKQMGGTGANSNCSSMVVDASGNVYAAGLFEGTVDFDPGPGLSNLSSSVPTQPDLFIIKLNASGNLVWVKQFTDVTASGGNITCASIAIDASGNVYTTGNFSGSIDFDPGAGTFSLTGNVSNFVSKLNASGNFIWAKQFQTNVASANAHLIAVDVSGNVYTTGTFLGTTDFDPGPAVFNMSGASTSFISKLDASGNFVWARQLGTGPETVTIYSMTLDASGNVCTTGDFAGTADFDPGPGVFNLSTTGGLQLFISEYDPGGNLIWAKQTQGSGGATGYSIATDAGGNVYCSGVCDGTVDFDPGAGLFNLIGPGGGFVLKWDAAGNFVWADIMVGTGGASGLSIAVDASKNVYWSGHLNGTVDFDPGSCQYDLTSTDYFGNLFVSKLDAAGHFAWAKKIDGSGDYASAMCIDPSGNVYCAGSFTGTADLDPDNGVYDLSALGSADGFILKLSPCTNPTSSAVTTTSCSPYVFNCITFTNSGVYTQTIPNAAGCDSIITLNLTIQHYDTTIFATACRSYTFQGEVHTISGLYTSKFSSVDGCDSSLTLNLTIVPPSDSTVLQIICEGESYAGYSKAGTWVDTLVAANGCDSIRTIRLAVQQKPSPDLGPDKNICPGDSLIISPGTFSNYSWQDGSALDHFTVLGPGVYSVDVSNHCGTGKALIHITGNICNIVFPSAFSPNKDGRNEVFKVLNAPVLSDYDLSVFNRWGQKVFETRDYTSGWDGGLNGQYADSGVYVWFCRFKKPGDPQKTEMKGTVVLIR